MKTDAARELGIEPGMRVWVGGHNVEARREIERHVDGTLRPPTGSIDKAFIAPQSVDEAIHFARKLMTRLVPDGSIWVVYDQHELEPGEPGQVDPPKDLAANKSRSDSARRSHGTSDKHGHASVSHATPSPSDSSVRAHPADAIAPSELHNAMQDLGLAPGESCELGDTYTAIRYDRLPDE